MAQLLIDAKYVTITSELKLALQNGYIKLNKLSNPQFEATPACNEPSAFSYK